GDDGDAGDVVAAVDAEALPPRRLDLAAPARVGRCVVPAQRAEAPLELLGRMAAERGDAAAGSRDHRREAAADVDMQAHRSLGLRQRHHDHVPEVRHLDADRGDRIAAREAVDVRLDLAREVGALEGAARQGEGAEPQPVALGVVDRHQLLGDEGPQDVQRRARHQVERLRDRLHAHRRLGAAEQAQDGDGAGDGGNGSWRHDCICTTIDFSVQRGVIGGASSAMKKLTDFTSYADAQANFASARLWELFDGDRERLNIAHECIDRHVAKESRGEKAAVIVVKAGGGEEILSYRRISEDSARFAHWLVAKGVAPGDRVAIKLEPSRAFYAAVFGAMKAGAIAVPLFTLFGPDGVKLRVEDCKPKLLIEDDAFLKQLSAFPAIFEPNTRAGDLAIFQYTSGTTRELPEAVKHTHRAIVTVMVAALYGTGLRPGDRFICPSSPAWGHGLWHGTLAPLAMGLTIGCYAGKFDAPRLLQALEEHRFTNISAAATHYRMMRVSGAAAKHRYFLEKTSFTGEPIDSETATFCEATFGRPMCSMYGTTEIGVILVSYPGAPDFVVKPGSLGKAIPGGRVEVQDAEGKPCPTGVTGEMKVWRRDKWIATKDLG